MESKGLNKSMTHELINKSDLSIAAGWRNLLPTSPGKLIIFHDSLLPKYRGFNPLVTALINGDDVLGVSALWAAENYDEGEIIFQEKVTIAYPIKIKQAIDTIEPLYANLTKNVLSVFETIINSLVLDKLKNLQPIVCGEINTTISLIGLCSFGHQKDNRRLRLSLRRILHIRWQTKTDNK